MQKRLEYILTGLIAAVFSLVLILVLARITGLANTLIAWAMLVLAFTAFMAIRHNLEQERRRWSAEQLKEVMDWVDDVLKYCAIYSYETDDAARLQFLVELTGLKLRADYITTIAESFGGPLTKPLEKVVKLFYQVYDKLQQEAPRRAELEEHCIEVKKVIAVLRNK